MKKPIVKLRSDLDSTLKRWQKEISSNQSALRKEKSLRKMRILLTDNIRLKQCFNQINDILTEYERAVKK